MSRLFPFLVSLCLAAFASTAVAAPGWEGWSLSTGTGAFFGEYQLGASKRFRDHHATGFVFGYSPDPLLGEIRQYTFEYAYTPWLTQRSAWLIRPLSSGFFLTMTDHREFFFKSPDVYREAGYYDATRLRSGFKMSSSVGRGWKRGDAIYGAFNLAILDQGFLSLFNNGPSLTLWDFTSVGFSVSYQFR